MRKDIYKDILQYILNIGFGYTLILAALHFIDADEKNIYTFLMVFGLIIMDIVIYTLYLLLHYRDRSIVMENTYWKNKKQHVESKTLLFDNKLDKDSLLVALKIIGYLLLAIIYLFILLYTTLTNTAVFMDFERTVGYAMLFVSIIYFDLFWAGGKKKFLSNIKSIKRITNKDSLPRKKGFYLILFVVALYQIYSFFPELQYGASLLL